MRAEREARGWTAAAAAHTAGQLKDLLRAKGLRLTGTKPELAARCPASTIAITMAITISAR